MKRDIIRVYKRKASLSEDDYFEKKDKDKIHAERDQFIESLMSKYMTRKRSTNDIKPAEGGSQIEDINYLINNKFRHSSHLKLSR